MMREYGVLERDVVLSEISQLAKAVGFRRMILKPYVSPEHVELDYEEFTAFKEGKKVSSPYLTSQEIADFIERGLRAEGYSVSCVHDGEAAELAALTGEFGLVLLDVLLPKKNGLEVLASIRAETAGDYKPKPRVYLAACRAFDLPPGDCMMVAAHINDLLAAAKCGLRTAHIARPNERGPGTGEAAPNAPVDIAAGSLEDLAVKLGV